MSIDRNCNSHLFIILPVGVVSKKNIGHLRMLSSRELCSLLDAIQLPKASARAAPNPRKPESQSDNRAQLKG